MEERIRTKLTAAFAPEALEIVNDSQRHHGHAGAGAESHFKLAIVARAFEGRSRIERHRMINQILKDELGGSLHALAINARTPEEARGLAKS